MAETIANGELYHHGILGQRWGIRRYQNEDGSLTEAGRERYGKRTNINNAWKELRGKEARNKVKFVASGIGAKAAFTAGLGAGALAPALPVSGQIVAAGMVFASTVASVKMMDINMKSSTMTNEIIRQFNDVKMSEIEIPKGTEMVRTSLNQKEDPNRRIYTSFGKEEGLDPYYKTEWPKMLRKIANDPEAKVYRNTYEVKTDIVAPSYEKRVQAAEAVLNANKKMLQEFGKAFAMDQSRLAIGALSANNLDDVIKTARANGYTPADIKEVRSYYDKTAKATVDSIINEASKKVELNDDSFRKFTASIPKDDKLMNAYIKELKKQGYNAVYDDNSNSRAPFIIFDPNDLDMVKSEEIAKIRK